MLFVLLSFTLMVSVTYYLVSRIVERQIFVNAQEAINTAEVSIRSDLKDAEAVLFQVETLIKNWREWGDSYDRLEAYISQLSEEILLGSTWVSGFMNLYGIVDGRFISGLYEIPPIEEYIPEERPWYHTAVAAGDRIGFSPPYTDWETGIPVVSFTKNLFDENGEMLAIIVLDIDFTTMSSYIKSIPFVADSYGILCDENFTILVHPVNEYLYKPMDEASYGETKIAAELREDPGSVSTLLTLDHSGTSVMYIFRRIYNGWYLGIATPVSSYYQSMSSLAITLSVLGAIFTLILGASLIRLSIQKARSEEKNIEKSSFLARMSHEIRTPMNSILGMAELIQRKEVSGEVREYIEIIKQSGGNLLAIINDILDFSKIESGRLDIQNRDYHTASLINDMINMMRPRIVEKSLDFLVNVDSAIPAQLFGDEMRLRQIFTNLLTNAVKYTRKGFVSLDVGMEYIDDTKLKLIFSVKDSGIGVKPEDQGRLFSEFGRVDSKANQDI